MSQVGDYLYIVWGFVVNVLLSEEMLLWVLVFSIGIATALAELLSRYNYSLKVFKVTPSYIYLLINGLSSLIAYYFILTYNIDFGPWSENSIGKAIAAGVASSIILRSSVASIKTGDKTFEAGLAPVVQVFLNTADRAFDQKRSANDIEEIANIMRGVKFDLAKKNLPPICFRLLNNISDDETKIIGEEISNLDKAENVDKYTKTLDLGIILERITGLNLLRVAVSSLGDVIKNEEATSRQKDKETISDLINKLNA